ncbi:hypothetical protein [Maribacter sp. 2307ULW6-5]|uniref:hypothetical protein n=1 Tax=Maribacter sp. 2307ULW6-5 TaxID=3386275 RepID=UPI0039BCBB05
MKKVLLFSLSFSFCMLINAQDSSSFNVNQALMNGCTDGTRNQGKQFAGSAYNSIMYNGSLSAEYKEAWLRGYSSCYSGGKYYWKKR